MTQSLDELIEDLKKNLADYEIEEFCDKLLGGEQTTLREDLSEIKDRLRSIQDAAEEAESAVGNIKDDISELHSMLKKY